MSAVRHIDSSCSYDHFATVSTITRCVSLPNHYVARDGSWTGPCCHQGGPEGESCGQLVRMAPEDIEEYRCRQWEYTRPRGTSRQRAATSRSRMQCLRRMERREASYVEFKAFSWECGRHTDSRPPPWALWKMPSDGTRYA